MNAFRHPSIKLAAIGAAMCAAALALAALSGCADVTRSVLYPESFTLGVRTGNRVGIDGMNAALQWKLKPREVVPADR